MTAFYLMLQSSANLSLSLLNLPEIPSELPSDQTTKYKLLQLTRLAVPLVHDPIEDAVPASRGGHLEEEDHALAEGLEVVDFVQGPPQFDRHEEAHAEYCEYEHD